MMEKLKAAVRRIPGAGRLARLWRHRAGTQAARYPSGHFYSPLPDLREVRARADVLFNPDVTMGPDIDIRDDAQQQLLAELAEFYSEFPYQPGRAGNYRYHTRQNHFGLGSAFVLYAMLRRLRPSALIEIGSGFSTAVTLDTNEHFLGGGLRLVLIEPNPGRLLTVLRDSDRQKLPLVADAVQDVPLSTFEALNSGDILFIDSSHVSKVGSDVNYLLFHVLPRLRKGVVIHFHDIGWPFEYPLDWVTQGIAWNEAYLVRAFLQYNRHFEILFFNAFASRFFKAFIDQRLPACGGSLGGSLWLRKVAE